VKFILYHVTQFEPMTAVHFDQPYDNDSYVSECCPRANLGVKVAWLQASDLIVMLILTKNIYLIGITVPKILKFTFTVGNLE